MTFLQLTDLMWKTPIWVRDVDIVTVRPRGPNDASPEEAQSILLLRNGTALYVREEHFEVLKQLQGLPYSGRSMQGAT